MSEISKTIPKELCASKKFWLNSLLCLGLTILSLFCFPTPLNRICAGAAIVAVDFYIMWVLLIGSVRSDGTKNNLDRVTYKDWHYEWYPIRTVGLLMVGLFFLTLVFGFAAIYRSIPEKLEIRSAQNPTTTTNLYYFTNPLTNWQDAIYFSTAATVGFGDITPQQKWSKWTVMGEIVSCLLLLVGVVSFLISRITDFGSELTPEEKKTMAEEAWNDHLEEAWKNHLKDVTQDAEIKKTIIAIMTSLIK